MLVERELLELLVKDRSIASTSPVFGLLKSAMDMPYGFRSGNGSECGCSNLLTSKQRGMCAEWQFKSRKMAVIFVLGADVNAG